MSPAEDGDDRPTRVLPRGENKRQPVDTDDMGTAIGSSVVGHLVVAEGPRTGTAIPFFRGSNTIGRGPGNLVVLDHGDDGIHREAHALLVFESGTCRLAHGGKPNPVYVNSVAVDGVVALRAGDVIELGDTKLRVELLQR